MLYATLFGRFSLSVGEGAILREHEASPKLLSALAYLTANMNKRIPIRSFSRFLHEGQNTSYAAASDSLVKTALHRVRHLIAPLQKEDPNVTLICRDGGIYFSPDLVFSSDAERFDSLYKALRSVSEEDRAKDRAHTRFCYERLFSLYQGEYLPFVTNDDTIIATRARYRADYLTLCEDYFDLLADDKDYATLIEKASEAIAIDPYCEAFYYHKIRAFAQKGDVRTALLLFESIETLLKNRFHVNPSARLRALKTTLSPLEDTESASSALASLRILDAPLSVESFAALLRYLEASNKAGNTLFVLIKAEEDILPVLLKKLAESLPRSTALAQLSAVSLGMLCDKDELQRLCLREKLTKDALPFVWEEHPIG